MSSEAADLQNKTLEIQSKMAELQKRLVLIEIEGDAGAGMVKLVLNGRYEAKKVMIDPSLLTQPMEVLCDLIASAVTDATRKVEVAVQNEMLKILNGINIPK